MRADSTGVLSSRFDLGDWRWSDATTACAALRRCAREAESVEAAARAIVGYLRRSFVVPATGEPAFVLARLFKTEEKQHLPTDVQPVAERAGAREPTDRVLTLLATDGDDPAWRQRTSSVAHQAIPLLSSESVRQAPMIAALVDELGVGVDTLVRGADDSDAIRTDFNVFHVEVAAGSERVPAQDFVRDHGVESVLGFGGVLPSGHVFAVVLFSRVPITAETAQLFRLVALSAKLALIPLVGGPVFDGEAAPRQRPAVTAEAQLRALEQMLDVHEQTSREQAARLEDATARLRREAEIVETLRRVGESLSSVLDVESVVNLTTTAAVDVTGAQFGAFFYNVEDDRGESYMLYALAGVPREEFARFPMPRNTAVFAPTFRGEGVVRSADITKDPRYGLSAPHHGMPEGHLPVRGYLAAPVISPTTGDVLGGLFFGHELADVFDERAERLAVGIAAQTAIALDNARIYHRERQTALQLQQALLPGELVRHADVTVAHAYRPGTSGLHVGGDWYDVVSVPGGRIAFVIGDVMGRGVHAAATMGQLRTAIRTLARLGLPPGAVVDEVNRIVLELPDEHIATLIYAVYDPEAATVSLTSAGHLPPVRIAASGVAAAIVVESGPPLGIPHATFVERTISIEDGEALVLFTDGLVETRTRSADEGVRAVETLLSGLAAQPQEACDKLIDSLTDASAADDIAILYIQFTGGRDEPKTPV